MLRWSRDGGEIVVGNFSQDNPSESYQGFGDWSLAHRSRSQLLKIAVDAGILPEHCTVEAEPLGVNLFLRIRVGENVN